MRFAELIRKIPGFRNVAVDSKDSYGIDEEWSDFCGTEPLFSLLDISATSFCNRPCINLLGKSYGYAEIGDLLNHATQRFQQIDVDKGTRETR